MRDIFMDDQFSQGPATQPPSNQNQAANTP